MSAQKTHIWSFDGDALKSAARLIREGGLVAVPTETVYGLAADATNAEAVARIYEAKGRPSFNPLIVHVSPDEAERHGFFDEQARALARAFWPGPLTIVVPRRASSNLAPAVCAGLPSVALRCPAHVIMQSLMVAAGRPLAAPSANRSGTISPTRAEHVLESLSGRISCVLDGGLTERGLESTIVAVDQEGVRLLRPGPVTPEQIEAVLNPATSKRAPIRVSAPVPSSVVGRIEAPGQLMSHYAPTKRLRLNAIKAKSDEWLIGFGPVTGNISLSASGDLEEAAAKLFDLLHLADAGPNARIAVAPIPEEGLGVAINDRLRRAAAPRGSDA